MLSKLDDGVKGFLTVGSCTGGGFYDTVFDGIDVRAGTVALERVVFENNHVHIRTLPDASVLAQRCTFERTKTYDWNDAGGANGTLYTDTELSTLTTTSGQRSPESFHDAPGALFMHADDARFTNLRKVRVEL